MNFIDLKSQYASYKDEIQKEINQVLDTSSYIMGPIISEVERDLNEFVGVSHSITCSSGTDALILGLMALGLKRGDEVIIPVFSFFATAEVISFLGAKPIFVDIEADTYNIDVSKIEEKITSKTKGVMPVSLYGQVADMDEIMNMAQKYSLWVLEDGAQSFGSMYKKKRSCSVSHVGATSFFPAKPLGVYGDGGAVFTNDMELSQKIKELRDHGSQGRYNHVSIGINGRMDSIQAAVLKVKLKHFSQEIERRQESAEYYSDQLKSLRIKLPVVRENRSHVYAQYTIEVDQRDRFQKAMSDMEIPTAVHYPKAFHQLPIYLKDYGHEKYPVAEAVALKVISLPICSFIQRATQDKVIEGIKRQFS